MATVDTGEVAKRFHRCHWPRSRVSSPEGPPSRPESGCYENSGGWTTDVALLTREDRPGSDLKGSNSVGRSRYQGVKE